MNILPPTPNPVTTGPSPLSKQDLVTERKQLKQAFQEQFSPEAFQEINAAWKSNPDVRMGVLAQAQQFSADTNYPTPAQLNQLAAMIVGNTMAVPPMVQNPPAPVVTSTPDSTPPVAAA